MSPFTVVICDEVDPDRWHGEIRLGGHILVKTEAVPTYEQASRQARNAFEAKVVEIFQR